VPIWHAVRLLGAQVGCWVVVVDEWLAAWLPLDHHRWVPRRSNGLARIGVVHFELEHGTSRGPRNGFGYRNSPMTGCDGTAPASRE